MEAILGVTAYAIYKNRKRSAEVEREMGECVDAMDAIATQHARNSEQKERNREAMLSGDKSRIAAADAESDQLLSESRELRASLRRKGILPP